MKKIIDLEIIDELEGSGVFEIALVDNPAMRSFWLTFKEEEMEIEPNPCWEGYEPYGLKEDGTPNCIPVKGEEMSYDNSNLPPYTDQIPKKKKKMIFASEDQQILVGAVAIPDKAIYRKDEETGQEYWVKFSDDVVKRMAEKFMREKRIAETNIEHDISVDAKSYIFESWIVEGETDKANSVYDLGVPVGTWVVKMRVTDPKVWAKIKSGELRAFSLEGSFIDSKELEEFERDKKTFERIMGILKQKMSDIN